MLRRIEIKPNDIDQLLLKLRIVGHLERLDQVRFEPSRRPHLRGNRAKRAATPEHPFGYGRERYVYAFVVSIVLFSIGGLFALYEAWHKWRDPHPIESWQWVPIAVLLVAMLMEGYALRTAAVESHRVRGGRSWNEFVRTAKAPELPVILLEDCGALLDEAVEALHAALALRPADTGVPQVAAGVDQCAGLSLHNRR